MGDVYELLGTRDLTDAVGKKLAEALVKISDDPTTISGTLAESYGIKFKEDLTLDNSTGAYTVMLAENLYAAAVQKVEEIINIVPENRDLIEMGGGAAAYKIPRIEPTIAVEVAEGEVVSYTDVGPEGVVFTPKKRMFGTKITWELARYSAPYLLQFIMNRAAGAIARKLASDIVNGLSVATHTDNVITGGVSYDNIIDAIAKVRSATSDQTGEPYGFEPDVLVLYPDSLAVLEKSTDWKHHVYYTGVIPGTNVVTVNRPVRYFGNLKIITTPYLTAKVNGKQVQALVLDSTTAAMLIKGSEFEVYDGRIPGSADTEIVGVLSYVLGVIYNKAISVVTA